MKLPEGSQVRWRPSPGISVTGAVCGLAHVEMATIGQGYIVRLDAGQLSHPYSCVVAEEIHLEVLEDGKFQKLMPR